MLKRILMNQADASPGNSAPAAPPAQAAPAAPPQAQGATVTLTQADLDAKIAAAVEQGFTKAKDSFYAEARRATEASNRPKAKTPATGDAEPGPQPLSASEERTFLRGLDRTIAQLGIAPNSAQYASAERDLLVERPGSVDAWVKERFEGFGKSPASSQQQPAAASAATQPVAPAQPQNAQPASSRGAPPAPQVPLEEMDLWTMSDSDRAAFIKQKGIKAYNEKLRQQGKGRAVSFR